MLARDDECWSYRTGFHCNGPSMSDWYPKRTFANLLEDAAKRWGPHEALFHEGRRFSFDALKAQVDATPRDFLKSASRRGTGSRYGCRTVPSGYSHSWHFPRSAPLPWPLNTRFRAVDLEYLLRQSDARTLISVDRSGPVEFLSIISEIIPEVRTQAAASTRAEASSFDLSTISSFDPSGPEPHCLMRL